MIVTSNSSVLVDVRQMKILWNVAVPKQYPNRVNEPVISSPLRTIVQGFSVYPGYKTPDVLQSFNLTDGKPLWFISAPKPYGGIKELKIYGPGQQYFVTVGGGWFFSFANGNKVFQVGSDVWFDTTTVSSPDGSLLFMTMSDGGVQLLNMSYGGISKRWYRNYPHSFQKCQGFASFVPGSNSEIQWTGYNATLGKYLFTFIDASNP